MMIILPDSARYCVTQISDFDHTLCNSGLGKVDHFLLTMLERAEVYEKHNPD